MACGNDEETVSSSSSETRGIASGTAAAHRAQQCQCCRPPLLSWPSGSGWWDEGKGKGMQACGHACQMWAACLSGQHTAQHKTPARLPPTLHDPPCRHHRRGRSRHPRGGRSCSRPCSHPPWGGRGGACRPWGGGGPRLQAHHHTAQHSTTVFTAVRRHAGTCSRDASPAHAVKGRSRRLPAAIIIDRSAAASSSQTGRHTTLQAARSAQVGRMHACV